MSHSMELPAAPAGYRYERALGRGGMGVVYLAIQLETRQQVAIKVLDDPHLRSEQLIRFRREMQIPAQLSHPHIVGVKEASWGDPPHIVLEYCSGGSLAARLRGEGTTVSLNRPTVGVDKTRGQADAAAHEEVRQPALTPLPISEAAEIMSKIAGAAGALHALGFLHRDIKPANILLDANGDPKLADFGLAKQQDDHDVTVDGQPGTFSYMAPELLLPGEEMKADELTEVYSLGVTLYELLTGARPFAAKSTAELRRKILEDHPQPPRQLRADLPRDLEIICLKCLARERSQRYASARELANDLDHWLENEPIIARPLTLAYYARCFARRNPWGTGMALVAILISLAYATWWWIDSSRVAAEVARLRSEAESHFAKEELEEGLVLLRDALRLVKDQSWGATLRAELQQQVTEVLEPQVEAKRRLEKFREAQRDVSLRLSALFSAAAESGPSTPIKPGGLSLPEKVKLLDSYERGLNQYGVLVQAHWRDSPLWSRLEVTERTQLMSEVEELWIDYCNLQMRSLVRSLRPAGIGLILAIDDEPQRFLFRIEDLRKDGPADQAKLRLGDKILAIDGKPASDFADSQKMFSALGGLAGGKARLIVVTNARSAAEEVTMIRQSAKGVGLGGRRIEQLFVAYVEPGSDAESAGLEIGDLLLYIDDVPAEGSVDPKNPVVFHFAGLAQALDRTAGQMASFVFYRPLDNSIRTVEFPWGEENRRIFRRQSTGILARTIRTEVGGVAGDLLAGANATEPEIFQQVLSQIIIDQHQRGGWTAEWVREAWETTRITEQPRFRAAIQLQGRRDFPAAEQEWELHLKQERDPDAELNQIICQVQQARWSSVIQSASRYLERRPQDDFAYFFRGHAHEILGDSKAAVADYRRSLVFGPRPNAEAAVRRLSAAKENGNPMPKSPSAKP